MKKKIKDQSGSGRLVWVDYATGISIILVVYRHVLIGVTRSGLEVDKWLIQANEMVYSFRMPLFFVLSGIFIARSIQKRTSGQFYFMKFNTILYPYFVWGFIQITLQIFLSHYTNASRGGMDYLYLFINPRAIDQLWYLAALFNVNILFHVLYRHFKMGRYMLFFLGFVMYYFSVHFKDYSLIHDTLYFFVFFSLGNMLNEFFIQTNKYRIQTVFVIFFSLLPFFVATQYYWLHNQDMHVIPFFGVTMIGVFIIFAFSRLLSYYGSLNFIRIVGLHSLYIYLMHLLIISSSRMLLVNILKVEVSEVILLTGWTAGVFLPIILYKWMRTNFFKYLFQMKY